MNNVYAERLRETTPKTKKELIDEKKMILQLLHTKAMLGEMNIAEVSRISSLVNGAYDQYIPEEPSMFKK